VSGFKDWTPRRIDMDTVDLSQLEADFVAYNKTGNALHVTKYSLGDVESFIKRVYEIDNTPSLMAARSGAIRYLRVLGIRRPSFGRRLLRFLRALFLLALLVGLFVLAARVFLAQR